MKINMDWLNTGCKKIGDFCYRHRAAILGVAGIGATAASLVMVNSASKKADKLVEAKKEELQVEKLPPIDFFKTVWRTYLPAVITYCTGAGLEIASIALYEKDIYKSTQLITRLNAVNASLATATTKANQVIKDYKDTAKDILGPEKAQEIDTKVAEKQANKAATQTIIAPGEGQLFYEPITGRFIRSTRDALYKALFNINMEFQNEEYITFADIMPYLGVLDLCENDNWAFFVNPKKYGREFNEKTCLDIRLNVGTETGMAPNVEPYILIEWNMDVEHGDPWEYVKQFI